MQTPHHMARMSKSAAKDAEHLNGFDCERCGHSAVAHYRNPGCRSCPCNSDPKCWCGDLTSKHEVIA